ncbi:MAG: transposase [Candidatus Thiodiazotropha sp. (ex Troendleina suluensis)]|nr:transposase [Candidatus Thiodiazotropha sp. (ex Troendleina suluensis)]
MIQRGNSRQPVLFESDDYHAYLAWLKEGADKHGCAIHAYCLMTNHVHLLLTPESPEAISKTIQFVGRHYVPYINHTYGQSGTLWNSKPGQASFERRKQAPLLPFVSIEMKL